MSYGKKKSGVKTAACLVAALLLCLCFAGPLWAQGAPAAQSAPVASGRRGSTAPPASGAVGSVGQAPLAGNGLYQPSQFEVQAQGVCLVNADSGAVVYQKNADKQFESASLVKMVTCLLLLEHVEDLDAPTIPADVSVFNELAGQDASHADIWRDEVLTARELLYAMLLPSANEAALVTAQFVSGGYVTNFVYMMNSKAESLGCTGTVFADPNGLSPQNRSTAHDMCLIVQEFMRHPVLAQIAATDMYEMPAHNHPAPYNIFNTNRLLVAEDPYAYEFPAVTGAIKGGKTGSIGEWQNFASMAEKDGETYYLAVMHSPDEADPIAPVLNNGFVRPALYESARLYNWVFENYTVRPALDTTQPITEAPVKYSTQQGSVQLMPTEDVKTVLPKDASQQVEKVFDIPDFLPAPVRQGDAVGTVTLMIAGQVVGTSKLVAAQNVSRNTTLYVIEKIKEFFGSSIFGIAFVVAVVAVGAYIAFAVLSYRKKIARQKKPPGRAAARPPAGGPHNPNRRRPHE